MKIAFKQMRVGAERMALMEHAERILTEETEAGFTVTLRTLHYKFVGLDLYPEDWAREVEDRDTGKRVWTKNNQLAYDKLGELVNDGRLIGVIDWAKMDDETRGATTVTSWDSPGEIVAAAANQYKINAWQGQPIMPEIWVEKDARIGVIGKVAKDLFCPAFSARGYPSQTSMYDNAERIRRHLKVHDEVRIYYSGDHDPSGLDIPEDIQNRLNIFLGPDAHRVTVERVALSMAQVKRYKLIDNFAKLSDGRAKKYIEKYGNKSWELDALDSQILYDIVRDQVVAIRDEDTYAKTLAKQKGERKIMQAMKDNWNAVAAFLEGRETGVVDTNIYPPKALKAMLVHAYGLWQDGELRQDWHGLLDDVWNVWNSAYGDPENLNNFDNEE